MRDFFNIIIHGVFVIATDFFVNSDLALLLYFIIITLLIYYLSSIINSLRNF